MTQNPPHIPVLLDEVLSAVQPCEGQVIVDCTFGAGGYTRAFLQAGANVVAFDRDPNAIAAGQPLVEEFKGRLSLVHAPFSQMQPELAARDISRVDAIVMDLGISSMQIDEGARGFSFRRDGPLDMRMSASGKSAADLVNTLPEEDLANILYQYGEERKSRVIARAIVNDRKTTPFTTTLQLAGLIERVLGRHSKDKIHPATRSFQALRIAVNEELDELVKALESASTLLERGGRLIAVTFHSLEDRIVKQFLAEARAPSRHVPLHMLKKSEWKPDKPVSAGDHEIARNPRSRSARLRAATKI